MSPKLQIVTSKDSLLVRQHGVGVVHVLGVAAIAIIFSAARLFRVLGWVVRSLESDDIVLICLSYALLAVIVGSICLVIFASITSEVLQIDRKHCRLARKEVFKTWQRATFAARDINKIKYGVERISDQVSINGFLLVFNDHVEKMFESLTRLQIEEILKACETFGIPTEHDPSVGMLRDIQKRGWLVNPWRPDPVEEHPKEQ